MAYKTCYYTHGTNLYVKNLSTIIIWYNTGSSTQKSLYPCRWLITRISGASSSNSKCCRCCRGAWSSFRCSWWCDHSARFRLRWWSFYMCCKTTTGRWTDRLSLCTVCKEKLLKSIQYSVSSQAIAYHINPNKYPCPNKSFSDFGSSVG